jgi:hypothetical protein
MSQPVAVERTLKLYKSSLKACQYVMPSGKYLYFINGRYATDDEEEIAELDKQIKARHPHITVDAAEAHITETAYKDPLSAIKAKAIEEYLASQRDMGTSETPKNTGIGTSASLAALKANSNSASK